MGCKQSIDGQGAIRVFGATGLHVGRHGDVDLASRSISTFDLKFVEVIKDDKLHDAKRLHLSNNKLYTLGKEMALLPDIEELYINNNRFQRVPEVLSLMPNLRFLDISSNALGNYDHSLSVLPRIECLTHLVLRDCAITDIPTCILDCVGLEVLDLSNNYHLQLRDLQLYKLPVLRTLLIANCGIGGGLSAGIKEIRTLQSLDISSNCWMFNNIDFFGKWIPTHLVELHLRALKLSAVPHVVGLLRKLTYLDLAENPLETLDILAGRIVCRGEPRTACVSTESANNDGSDDALSGSSQVSVSVRANVSQSGRMGLVAHVVNPIPLKKLCLRACALRTVPKYFHKLTSLVDIDLSENERLSDENLTLFLFQNLEVLNIVGCPFAKNTGLSKNVWFDIAKLRNLHTLNWDVWRGVHNMSPYRTRIPVEICGLPLRRINDLTLRPKLFVPDTLETIVNLVVDGYFKVDFSMDSNLVDSHAKAVEALDPLEGFFFKKEPVHEGEPVAKIASEVLQICINRYIFFLTMQAANYNTLIVPPADVMAIHYAQMTQTPTRYRNDCEAICGQVLSCNYRFFFLEHKLRPNYIKETLDRSKRVWSMLLRAAQKDLRWLRYDFWEKRGGEQHFFHEVSSIRKAKRSSHSDMPSNANMSTVPTEPAASLTCALDSVLDLKAIDSIGDLRTVLDRSITSHFEEQGLQAFEHSLRNFFKANKLFLRHEGVLQSQNLDWSRYVKYLTLVAHVHDIKRFGGKPLVPSAYDNNLKSDMLTNNSIIAGDSCLPQPPPNSTHVQHRSTTGSTQTAETLGNTTSPQRVRRRASSFLATSVGRNRRRAALAKAEALALHTHPVPTIGLTLLLHCHRTDHAKYYQTLMLLGIEDVDIVWERSSQSVEATMMLWEALYNERYVDAHSATVSFDVPKLMAPIPTTSQEPPMNLNAAVPLQSAMKHGNWKKQRHVQVALCCADTQKGVY